MNKLTLATIFFLAACTPITTPAPTPQIIRIYATAATQPWQTDAFNCADKLGIILSNVVDPKQADISIRMGEPEQLSSPAFQIGQNDLLILTNPDSPHQDLTLEEARNLFSHPDSTTTEVWVFASEEDIQQIFTLEVMRAQTVSTFARVAVSPRQMSDALNQGKNVVGLLPRRWKPETARDIFTLSNVPILAVVQSPPQGLVKELLACLQK